MSEKKHVIFVIHTLAIGGAERQIAGLANYLAEQGLQVTIVLLDDHTVQYHICDKVKVVFLSDKYSQPISLLDKIRLKFCSGKNREILDKYLYLKERYINKLRDYVRQYPEAVVITRMLLPNTVGAIALKPLKNRFIFFDASYPDYGLSADAPMLILRNRYLHRADAAVFQTEIQKAYYKGKLACEQYIIPNFIPTEKLPRRFKGTRKKEIVSFCRLTAVKNIPLLIEAFAALHKIHPDYSLKIYGDGPEKDNIEALIAEMRMEHSVALFPAIPDVHKRVADAALFVSSSDREGLSNSMLEAMAIGLPSVCTDCIGGGAKLIIEKYGCGVLVPCRDVSAMAKAMCSVIENREFAESLSAKGEAMAKDLSIESVGEMWRSIIEQS